MSDQPTRNRAAEPTWNAEEDNSDSADDQFCRNNAWVRSQFELVHRELINVKSENAWLWEVMKDLRSHQEIATRSMVEELATLKQNINTRVQEMTDDLLKLHSDITVIQSENAVLQWQIKKLQEATSNDP